MLGVAKAAAELGVPVAMDTFLGAVENLIDGDAYKPGDILSYPNGVTVEIHNTDAEAVWFLPTVCCVRARLKASRMSSTLRPSPEPAWSPSAKISQDCSRRTMPSNALSDACQANSEGLWRLPLHDPYNDMLKSDTLRSKMSGRSAGATTAAAVSACAFVDVKWAHLDVANSAFRDKGGAAAPRARPARWFAAWSVARGLGSLNLPAFEARACNIKNSRDSCVPPSALRGESL